MSPAAQRQKLLRQIVMAQRSGDAQRYLDLIAEYNRVVKGGRV